MLFLVCSVFSACTLHQCGWLVRRREKVQISDFLTLSNRWLKNTHRFLGVFTPNQIPLTVRVTFTETEFQTIGPLYLHAVLYLPFTNSPRKHTVTYYFRCHYTKSNPIDDHSNTYLQKCYRSRISNHWAIIPACSVEHPIYKQSKKTYCHISF